MINITSFPIQYDGSSYNNVFKGFVEELIELKIQDETSCSIVDNGGLIRLESFTDYTPIAGDEDREITIFVGGEAIKGIITTVSIAPFHLDTDIPFTAAASGISFLINYPSLRMTYRLCEFTTLNDQTATNLLNEEFDFYPDINGDTQIDISIIKNIFKPNLGVENAINTDMCKSFQVQMKRTYDGSSESWVSVHDTSLPSFVPFVSVHAVGRVASYGHSYLLEKPLIDLNDSRVWRGYDKYITSVVNGSNAPTTYNIYAREYDNTKALLTSTTLKSSSACDNGIYNAKLPTLNANTRYVKIYCDAYFTTYTRAFTVYDTKQDNTEYYLGWVSDLGSINGWLFTSKALHENKTKLDILEDSEFRQIPTAFTENITLIAKGLTESERIYIDSIYQSNKIQLTFDGSDIDCIVSKPSYSYENRKRTFTCEIEIELKQMGVMNV